ncbi:hypothetical protein J4217_03740 [Candidatus Pacearchaeota archaeon]|nr:hypothetical protein [uncultured archaeon]AQS33248.1 hypothetical protein [uncultured archaeon]MBS3091531.1 hypothetical protein [Candidatus Pacearchaeota archaeon]
MKKTIEQITSEAVQAGATVIKETKQKKNFREALQKEKDPQNTMERQGDEYCASSEGSLRASWLDYSA